MSLRPTRQTAAGRAYLDLQNLARRTGRPTDELHQIYALEGFLDRLAHSEHAERFILKGGVLLAAYDARRPTRDIDLSARAIANETGVVRDVVAEVLAREIDDGLAFDRHLVTAETIRDQDDYGGVRVFVVGSLAAARLHFHVDVNIADPITPAPEQVAIPRLLGGQIHLVGYPTEMVLAEKIVTAIERGTANTRWRDFVDIAALATTRPPEAGRLDQSLRAVARHRLVEPIPLADVLDGYAGLAQTRWARWRAKNRLEGSTPEQFGELLATVIALADPVIVAKTTGGAGTRSRAPGLEPQLALAGDSSGPGRGARDRSLGEAARRRRSEAVRRSGRGSRGRPATTSPGGRPSRGGRGRAGRRGRRS